MCKRLSWAFRGDARVYLSAENKHPIYRTDTKGPVDPASSHLSMRSK